MSAADVWKGEKWSDEEKKMIAEWRKSGQSIVYARNLFRGHDFVIVSKEMLYHKSEIELDDLVFRHYGAFPVPEVLT